MKNLFKKSKAIQPAENSVPLTGAMDALVYNSQMEELHRNLEMQRQNRELKSIIANMEKIEKDMVWNKLCAIEDKVDKILEKLDK